MNRLPKTELVRLYTYLLRLRRMEERVLKFVNDGTIPGMFHSYLGEESVPVAVVSQLQKDDIIALTHRGRAHAIVKGADPRKIFAEVLGKRDGICKGKGGEIHVADPTVGILGASGIVGGMVPISLGSAFAAQYNGTKQVTLSFFGDGAVNQGTFHESLNLASVWKLPIVFVCQNNGWAEFTPNSAVTSVERISERASSYNMPGVTVEDDILAVYDAAAKAIARARAGKGPTLLECKTHRMAGHHAGDQQKYRTKDDMDETMANDPLLKFQAKMLEEGHLTESDVNSLEERVAAEVEEAAAFAISSPAPEDKDLYEDVYFEGAI